MSRSFIKSTLFLMQLSQLLTSSNGPKIKMMNDLNIKVCKKHSSVFSELLCDVEIGLFSQQE